MATRQTARHFAGDVLLLPDMADAEFLASFSQDGFNLRIAFQFFRHALHLAFDMAPRLIVLPAAKLLALPLQFLPAVDQPVGPDIRVSLQGALPVHSLHELADALAAGKRVHGAFALGVILHGRHHEPGRSCPRLVELKARLLQFCFLAFQNRQPFAVLTFHRAPGAGEAVNGLLESGHGPQALGLSFPVRAILLRRLPSKSRTLQAPFPFRPLNGRTGRFELQPVEHAAPYLAGNLFFDLLRPLLGCLGAVLRLGRALGRYAPPEFQAFEPAAALPIAPRIVATVLGEILGAGNPPEILVRFFGLHARPRRLALRPGMLARNLDLTANAKLLGHPASLGEFACIIERRFFQTCPAKRGRQRLCVLELLPVGIELHAVAMPGHRHIGQMPVHGFRRQHEAAIDRCALRLVNRRRIAVVNSLVIFHRYGDVAGIF